MYDCIKDMIGVTESDCDCLVAGLSDEVKAKLKVSTSGFFMDKIPDSLNFKILKSLDACKDFATLAVEAKNQAIDDFQNDLTISISNLYKKSVRNYNGGISKAAYANTLQDDGRFQGLRMLTNEHADGLLTINRIRFIGNGAGDTTLKIARSFYGENFFETIFTLPFSALENNFATIALPDGKPLLLPMGKDLMPYDYRFYWDKAPIPGVYPKDTPLGCNCGGSDKDLLASYLQIEGISFQEEASGQYRSDSFSHGLIMDVELSCPTENLICREYSGAEDVAIAAKYAVAYRANEILNEKVLSSPEISRFTMQNREYLWGKRNHFRVEYQNRVQFISTRIDIKQSDCFACRDRLMFKGKIVS